MWSEISDYYKPLCGALHSLTRMFKFFLQIVKQTVKPEFVSNSKSLFCLCQIYILQHLSMKSDFYVLNLIFYWLTSDICQISHFWSWFYSVPIYISNLFAKYIYPHIGPTIIQWHQNFDFLWINILFRWGSS